MKIITGMLAVLMTGCATQAGNERQAQHGADQIRIVAVQKEAQVQKEQAQAAANEKLYEALARVAESNPQHAPSVAVALAVIGVSGGQSGEGDTDRVVTLQQQQNTALEWTKALAPTVGGLVTGLGVAAINADLAKTQSDNSRRIQESSNETSASIVDAVASVGIANSDRLGIQVGGDYITATDQAVIDQSTNTTTTSTTSSVSNSTEVSDSYNSAVTDSNNSTETNTTTTDTTTTTTTSTYDTAVTTSTTLTYGGTEMTLGSLIEYLQGLGSPYSLTVGGEVMAASTTGDGETVTVDCQFMFSPQHPDCV